MTPSHYGEIWLQIKTDPALRDFIITKLTESMEKASEEVLENVARELAQKIAERTPAIQAARRTN